MQGNKYIIVTILLVAISYFGNAQNNCVQNLRDARNAYDEGKLQDMPNLLSKCIDNGFTNEEKVEALRFLTLSYLFSEEQEKAEIAYLRLLKINPEFQVNEETDPTELIILSENYDTDPKFFYGLKLGSSYNFIDITEYYPVFNQAGRGSYEPPIGFGAGLFFQYPINDDFTANAEVHYNYRGTVLNRLIERAEGGSGGLQIITENQQWIEMPLLINYKIPLVDKFLLEATAGPSLHYLLSSYLSVQGGREEINNLDMIDFRNQLNVSGILGLRGNFKQLGRNYITVEALYQYRFIEEVDFDSPGRSQLNYDLLQVAYAENQYKGHAFILRLGFRFPRFNPELIK
jgi:hypothetical protein